MPPRIREYHSAASTTRALELLRRRDIRTQLLILGPRPPIDLFSSAAVVDLQPLELDYILAESAAPPVLRIGGMTPLQSLVEAPVIGALANGILVQAARLAAHLGLRNLASLAGALSGASHAAGGPPEVLLALLALNADAVVQGDTLRLLPLASWQPAAHELLLEVRVVQPAILAGGLARVARTPVDQAIVAAVAVVTDSTARVAVAGASLRPIIAEVAANDAPAAVTIDRLVEAVSLGAQATDDYRGSAEYRHAMARVLAKRALADAFTHGAEQ